MYKNKNLLRERMDVSMAPTDPRLCRAWAKAARTVVRATLLRPEREVIAHGATTR